MKKVKKFTAAMLAAFFMLEATACSSDKSWAAKNGSTTIPIGTYICYLYSEYSNASSKVSDSSKSVLSQKVEGKDAKSWIRDKTLTDIKSLFVIDSKMKELNLKLSDAENKSLSSSADSAWEQSGSQFEKWGVAKSSFSLAFYESTEKFDKVFNSIYGKGGKKEIADSELKNYYVKNDTDFSYISRPLYGTTNGKVTALTGDEKKKAENEFNGYLAKIKSGKMTMQQAADAYKTSSSTTSDQLQSDMVNLSTSSYPDSMKKMIEGMKAGEVKAGEISEGSASFYIIVMKNDITKTIDNDLKTENKRKTLLYNYKAKDFKDEINKEADSLKDIKINNKALNSYDPSMFETSSASSAS